MQAAEGDVQRLPGARAWLTYHEGRGGQLRTSQRRTAARPRMPRRHHDHQPVGPHDPLTQPVRHAGPLHEPQFHLPGQHPRRHVGGVDHVETHLHVGLPVLQLAEPARHQVLGHRHAGGHPQMGGLAVAHGLDGPHELLRGGEHLRGPPGHHLALGGERGAARRTLDQRQAEAAFELRDALAGGRLRDPRRPGGAPEAAQLADVDEELQRVEIGQRTHSHRL